jgi:hypothetical protein
MEIIIAPAIIDGPRSSICYIHIFRFLGQKNAAIIPIDYGKSAFHRTGPEPEIIAVE